MKCELATGCNGELSVRGCTTYWSFKNKTYSLNGGKCRKQTEEFMERASASGCSGELSSEGSSTFWTAKDEGHP